MSVALEHFVSQQGTRFGLIRRLSKELKKMRGKLVQKLHVSKDLRVGGKMKDHWYAEVTDDLVVLFDN